MPRTRTIDSHVSYSGDMAHHGTVVLTFSGLNLSTSDTYEVAISQLGNSARLATSGAVTVDSIGATTSIALESTALTAAMGARRDIPAQLYLWNLTDWACEWNGEVSVAARP